MSADNWQKCPNCKKEHKQKIEKYEQELLEAYQKTVSADEYLEMVRDRDKLKKEKTGDMAEYYWFHMDDDLILNIQYRCNCDTCGFEFSWTDEVCANNED